MCWSFDDSRDRNADDRPGSGSKAVHRQARLHSGLVSHGHYQYNFLGPLQERSMNSEVRLLMDTCKITYCQE
jgi:hypothetical protein